MISLSLAIVQTQLKPDTVISSLLDEYERLKIKERQLKAAESILAAAKGCSKGKRTSNNSTRSSSNSGKTNAECWNCGKKGHIQANCKSKAKDENRQSNSANLTKSGDD